MVIFEGLLILRFSVKFYDFSFILSHSNKGIKHYAEFDKKKFKREYLGRIIDNVDFFHEQSCVHFINMGSSLFA